jgi:hypothetical protein
MTGGHFLVSYTILLFSVELTLSTETMAEHRSQSLSALLPIALSTGFSEINPDHPPLQVGWCINSSCEEISDPDF